MKFTILSTIVSIFLMSCAHEDSQEIKSLIIDARLAPFVQEFEEKVLSKSQVSFVNGKVNSNVVFGKIEKESNGYAPAGKCLIPDDLHINNQLFVHNLQTASSADLNGMRWVIIDSKYEKYFNPSVSERKSRIVNHKDNESPIDLHSTNDSSIDDPLIYSMMRNAIFHELGHCELFLTHNFELHHVEGDTTRLPHQTNLDFSDEQLKEQVETGHYLKLKNYRPASIMWPQLLPIADYKNNFDFYDSQLVNFNTERQNVLRKKSTLDTKSAANMSWVDVEVVFDHDTLWSGTFNEFYVDYDGSEGYVNSSAYTDFIKEFLGPKDYVLTSPKRPPFLQ